MKLFSIFPKSIPGTLGTMGTSGTFVQLDFFLFQNINQEPWELWELQEFFLKLLFYF